LEHLKTLQHVSIFSDHLQGARRFLVKVTEFKSFKVFKIVEVICGDAAVCVVCVRGALCGAEQHNVWCVCVPHTHTHTKRYAAASPQLTFTTFKKTFKLSNFIKEPTSSLKMIRKDRNMLERF
jgi:hypothetical protein